jgi:hypothetical protein
MLKFIKKQSEIQVTSFTFFEQKINEYLFNTDGTIWQEIRAHPKSPTDGPIKNHEHHCRTFVKNRLPKLTIFLVDFRRTF